MVIVLIYHAFLLQDNGPLKHNRGFSAQIKGAAGYYSILQPAVAIITLNIAEYSPQQAGNAGLGVKHTLPSL